jgi:hypothetical protein
MTLNEGFKVFDPRLLTSFSHSNFKATIKRALFKSLRGKARLTGTGELVALYPYIESEANKNGAAGVIKWGDKLMIVKVSSIKVEKGKYIPEYAFTKNPDYQQYTELKIKLPVPVLDKNNLPIGKELKEQTFYAEGNDRNKLFAVLENDVEMTPDLEGIDDDLVKLESILDAIFHDIVISKKKIYFVFPQDPDENDWQKVNDMWNNNIMGYIALPKSGQDTGVDKEGIMKEGIDPDKIELKVYQPDNKGRDLWADYRNFMREMLWKYGIRFNSLEEKEERASVSEVEDSNSYFDNIDNERRQTRLNFINWVTRNWGGDYTLVYK